MLSIVFLHVYVLISSLTMLQRCGGQQPHPHYLQTWKEFAGIRAHFWLSWRSLRRRTSGIWLKWEGGGGFRGYQREYYRIAYLKFYHLRRIPLWRVQPITALKDTEIPSFVFVWKRMRPLTRNSLDCTLPGTTNFDYGFRVCLLLNYFLKRDTCTLPGTMVQSVHVAYDRWGLMRHTPSIVFRL